MIAVPARAPRGVSCGVVEPFRDAWVPGGYRERGRVGAVLHQPGGHLKVLLDALGFKAAAAAAVPAAPKRETRTDSRTNNVHAACTFWPDAGGTYMRSGPGHWFRGRSFRICLSPPWSCVADTFFYSCSRATFHALLGGVARRGALFLSCARATYRAGFGGVAPGAALARPRGV